MQISRIMSWLLQTLGSTVATAMTAQQGHFATIMQVLAQHTANKQTAMNMLQQQAQQLEAQIAAVPANIAAALHKVSAATAASDQVQGSYLLQIAAQHHDVLHMCNPTTNAADVQPQLSQPFSVYFHQHSEHSTACSQVSDL